MTVSRLMTMRSTAGAILALLAIGAAWPSRAQAGCHYRQNRTPGLAAAHLERLALAGALTLPIDERDLPSPAQPCAGMRCSNSPAPAPPATPAVAPVADQWVYLGDLSPGPDISSCSAPNNDRAVRPRHRGAAPFHPPR